MRTGEKRNIRVVVVIAFAIIMLSGCGLLQGTGKGQDVDADTAVEEINQNSTLPLPLLTPHDEVRDRLREDGSIDSIDNFMSFDYFTEGYTLIFSGYPNDDSDYCLTEVEVTNGDYGVFGVKVSDGMAQAAQVLEGYGYSAEEDDPSAYIKGGVIVSLEGDGQIEEIRIKVPTSYTSGNLY